MKINFDRLFKISSNPDTSVADSLENEEWKINFSRQFGKEEDDLWTNMKTVLKGVELNNDKDKVVCCLENSGKFSVKSLYRHWSLGRGGVIL